MIDRQAENTDMTTKIIKHTIFCVTFSCFVGTEFLKIQKSVKKSQKNRRKIAKKSQKNRYLRNLGLAEWLH